MQAAGEATAAAAWRESAACSESNTQRYERHAGTARSRPILTSLPLQVFIYFGGWWDVLFWVISILVFVYKGEGQELIAAVKQFEHHCLNQFQSCIAQALCLDIQS
jgi:hypothetical protein